MFSQMEKENFSKIVLQNIFCTGSQVTNTGERNLFKSHFKKV